MKFEGAYHHQAQRESNPSNANRDTRYANYTGEWKKFKLASSFVLYWSELQVVRMQKCAAHLPQERFSQEHTICNVQKMSDIWRQVATKQSAALQFMWKLFTQSVFIRIIPDYGWFVRSSIGYIILMADAKVWANNRNYGWNRYQCASHSVMVPGLPALFLAFGHGRFPSGSLKTIIGRQLD